jgi:hypothetical protein
VFLAGKKVIEKKNKRKEMERKLPWWNKSVQVYGCFKLEFNLFIVFVIEESYWGLVYCSFGVLKRVMEGHLWDSGVSFFCLVSKKIERKKRKLSFELFIQYSVSVSPVKFILFHENLKWF